MFKPLGNVVSLIFLVYQTMKFPAMYMTDMLTYTTFQISHKQATDFSLYSFCKIFCMELVPRQSSGEIFSKNLNPFVPNAPFLYLLKTSENRKVS